MALCPGQLHPGQVPRVRGQAKVTRQVALSSDLDRDLEISGLGPFSDRSTTKREAVLVAGSLRQDLAARPDPVEGRAPAGMGTEDLEVFPYSNSLTSHFNRYRFGEGWACRPKAL